MTIPREQLAKVVKDHRRNQSTGSGGTYECICGEPLTSNSHHRQAEHLADAIIQAGWTPPPTPAHNRDHAGICKKCGTGLAAIDIVDGEKPCTYLDN